MRHGTSETSVLTLTGRRLALLALLATCWLCACGGGDDGMQGVAGAQPTPGIGMPCTLECQTGLICERTGTFAGQCTASCGSGAACQQLAPYTACYGSTTPQCGLMCTTDTECPAGTTCQQLENLRGCKLAAMPTPMP